jgi:hypothetical protein
MKINLHIVIAILIIIIIWIVFVLTDVTHQRDRSLYGMWSADEKFKKSADLDTFILFINPPKDDMENTISHIGTKCNMYILIKSGGDTNYSGVTPVKIRNTSIMPNTVATYKIDLGKKIDILPRFIEIKYDYVNNMCIIHSGKTMYARVFKKPEASFNCRIHSKSVLHNAKSDDEDEDEDEEND